MKQGYKKGMEKLKEELQLEELKRSIQYEKQERIMGKFLLYLLITLFISLPVLIVLAVLLG